MNHMRPPSIFKKPQPVVLAVKLLWISFAIGLIMQLWVFKNASTTNPSELKNAIFFSVSMLAGFAFLIVCLSRRKNWARIIFLLCIIAGFLPTLSLLISQFVHFQLVSVVSIVQFGLQAYALRLLFVQSAADWFSTRKPQVPGPDVEKQDDFFDIKCNKCGFVAFGLKQVDLEKAKCLNCGSILGSSEPLARVSGN